MIRPAGPCPADLPTVTWAEPAEQANSGDVTTALATLLLGIVRWRERQQADQAGDDQQDQGGRRP
jgi:hypothetical protein